MPSDKPRITLRIEPDEMESLEEWAKEEFLTVPQLARVILKRAIATKKHPYTSDTAQGNAKAKGGK